MPIHMSPIPAVPGDGYYAKRAIIVPTAGQEQFDAEFRLNPTALVADEDTVQLVIDLADNLVDGIGYQLGLEASAGNPPHVVAIADEPVYTYICRFASRWARAEGNQMRGEPGDVPPDLPGAPATDAQPTDGRFGRMKSAAEKAIRAILAAKRDRGRAVGQGGIGVGFNTNPCGGGFPYGIDPAVVNGGL